MSSYFSPINFLMFAVEVRMTTWNVWVVDDCGELFVANVDPLTLLQAEAVLVSLVGSLCFLAPSGCDLQFRVVNLSR